MFPDLAAEYRGHERAVVFWNQLHEPWEVFRISVEAIEDRDDCVVAAIRVRDGVATEFVTKRTPEEALKALQAGPAATAGRPAG